MWRALVWQWLSLAKHGAAKQVKHFVPPADFVFHHTLTSACFPCLPSDVADNDARNEYRENDGFDRPLPHLGLVLETWAEGHVVIDRGDALGSEV